MVMQVGGAMAEVPPLPVPDELVRQEELVRQLQEQLDLCPRGRDDEAASSSRHEAGRQAGRG